MADEQYAPVLARLHVAVAAVSTSDEVSVPLAAGVPGTTLPLSRLPASTTVLGSWPAGVVITGDSLVPVIVIVATYASPTRRSSDLVAVKLSLAVVPSASAWVSGSALLSV